MAWVRTLFTKHSVLKLCPANFVKCTLRSRLSPIKDCALWVLAIDKVAVSHIHCGNGIFRNCFILTLAVLVVYRSATLRTVDIREIRASVTVTVSVDFIPFFWFVSYAILICTKPTCIYLCALCVRFIFRWVWWEIGSLKTLRLQTLLARSWTTMRYDSSLSTWTLTSTTQKILQLVLYTCLNDHPRDWSN